MSFIRDDKIDGTTYVNFHESYAAVYAWAGLNDDQRKDLRDNHWEPLVRKHYGKKPKMVIQVGGGKILLAVPRDAHEDIIRTAWEDWRRKFSDLLNATAEPPTQQEAIEAAMDDLNLGAEDDDAIVTP